jgi:hypothetical protein
MRIPVALALPLSLLGGPLALAQFPQPAPTMGTASMAVQITQARQRNAALMRTYTWNERADILKNGNSVDLRLSLVTYAPDGQLQRNIINDEHAPLPGGFFRRKAAESKIKDMENYLKGLRTLLDQYTLPTAGAVLNFLTTAVTSGPGPEGFLTTSGTNVVQPGDSLTIWTNAATRQAARMSINTLYQGSPVQVTATFKTLPSGLNYMNYATVEVPAQQLQLNIQNFDYVQN